MFAVWNPENDRVHGDNWILELDVSECETIAEAETRRNATISFLLETLNMAIRSRPLAIDMFVRSRW